MATFTCEGCYMECCGSGYKEGTKYCDECSLRNRIADLERQLEEAKQQATQNYRDSWKVKGDLVRAEAERDQLRAATAEKDAEIERLKEKNRLDVQTAVRVTLRDEVEPLRTQLAEAQGRIEEMDTTLRLVNDECESHATNPLFSCREDYEYALRKVQGFALAALAKEGGAA